MPTLLRQGGEAGSFEFTATLFDLIRRGVYTAKPVTTRALDLGRAAHGARSPTSSSPPATRRRSCASWEREVANVVDGRARRRRGAPLATSAT